MPLTPSSPEFLPRHIGPDDTEIQQMLDLLGYKSLDALINATIPPDIRLTSPLPLPAPRSESDVLAELRSIASQNKIHRSFLGQGYYGTITPPVIQRNILENPAWYTSYTPYQPEISQGRLEALMNFQTMIADLTGLPIANASLLDEATAAAEAMSMAHAIIDNPNKPTFFISNKCHPQTIAVVQTRAQALGIPTIVADEQSLLSTQNSALSTSFALLLQYPATDGRILDYSALVESAHKSGALVIVATDLLALTLIKPPGEWGADIAVGSSQRFGVPMGFGGPHAAFMATKPEFVRKMPGRLVGLSKDARGNPAYRLALQTREQHIRREKATSNICTAQVLLAIMASMYAVYHGPEGLKAIASRVHNLAVKLASMLSAQGHTIIHDDFFDTLSVRVRRVLPEDAPSDRIVSDGSRARHIIKHAMSQGLNLRQGWTGDSLMISLDETSTIDDVNCILTCLGRSVAPATSPPPQMSQLPITNYQLPSPRTSPFLTHPVFNTHYSETEMLRYIKHLESRDLSLCQSMIPLGSCTMKLNATAEMLPITWPEFANLHPFAPADQTAGYQLLFAQLEAQLAAITGLPAVSLQPNAGSQGEYAGLLTIRAYHEAQSNACPPQSPERKRGCADPASPTTPHSSQLPITNYQLPSRNICLIPTSAHGTNPASATTAGFHVIPIACDEQGNIDIEDLKAKATEHAANLGALMLTYPSTHGVFEPHVKQICQIIHSHGGQVYMDGANMNAQCGLTSPAEIGADICHLNLHKTFCIPHGGGGPGMGPICAAKHLAPYLPHHPLTGAPLNKMANGKWKIENPLVVSAAPHGSASILPISWTYIALMGAPGLTKASQVAILSANYMAKLLEAHYPVRFRGPNGTCAHEFIIDCRSFEASANVKVEDIAKRLMDYGFHAPTMSWPEVGTLMIEPTESEPKAELDRLCNALIAIREEIRAIEEGKSDRNNNPLKHAPHPAPAVTATHWPHPYPREQAAYPLPYLLTQKFWPPVARIDNPYGDRHLVCTCNTP